ncbi:1-deoxy-D-xylulose-5-phosphate synthase [Pelomonas aquatica]|jgi:1-deoxy-D-xylulose-5-phosphate synthase|uniref:1-deoxy-D-xylulose-5-phosphate synthase n=1 Tax=Pelomonas aquatica TaxID=431058 RepID=A0A9X4R7M2_9BURK|nr:1-deoxy-D-xylulose-5-phosphate synthase [Pelomonas aquatica]MCY4755588.1 1-deoxy-D-xylulose-5-phosphate synthase [Pelomonas aquatica]MDG0862198.1 1-deoxy-D-xylulose-5-phosphate synthase [Pelomonas aquatica]
MDYTLLKGIDSPADLRRLPRTELRKLADELRAYVLESVSKTGGHLGSNLGTVELTVALHYVFNTPEDRLVWDVGHQTYPHKVLTGRRDRMGGLRQIGGISGFPRRDESEYDTFGTGHSSTSISAAHGMAMAAKLKGENRKAVAIIGDGSMTAGMAFEALNNAGVAHGGLLGDVLVILNDNDMSISPPVGALNKYLARLMSGSIYSAAREGAKSVLKNTPLYEFARKFEEHTKGMVVPGTIFEEFGFNYVGPIDGHDLDALIPTLENLRDKKGPQFLHIVTKKGAGYKLAEADPVKYHAASGKFDPAVGFVKPATPPKTTFTQVFGDWLCDMAEQDQRLVGITPAMREGSGMVEFHKRFPQRYHDVGIAEQHSVTFAAGLACEGIKPVVAIYSTFLQRAYDQMVHDVAIQNLPVLFALDRAGLVGADGATHAGNYDIAYTRCIPNMAVLTPADEDECRQALYTGFLHDGPVTVRYPRGAGAGVVPVKAMTAQAWGRGEIRRKGQRIAVLAFGTLLYPALEAAERLDATVANMRFVKPLDTELVAELARTHDALVTLEDGCIMGGAGSAVTEALNAAGIHVPVLQLGLPDEFVEHGDPAKLMSLCGLDAAGIEASIVKRFGAKPQVVRSSAAG